MSDVSYVRTEMLGEQPAPASTVGAVGWIRANFFSSVPNTILTIVALFLVYVILSGLLPWIFLGVWNADSLSECREIFAARYGDGIEYACWGVIKDRWQQIIFGFYSTAQYWRPLRGWARDGSSRSRGT